MIGTNAEPSDYFTASKSSAQPHDTSCRMQSQGMAVEATKNFLLYLKRWPKVGFVNPPEGTINVGDFTNPPHLFGDILTFMQENVKMMKYWKTGKGTKGRPLSKLAKLQREKDKNDGKTNVSRKHLANALDQIKPQLELLWDSVKIDFKVATPQKIQRATDRIARNNLTKQDGVLLKDWAGSKIAVLSTCVATLLRTKSTNPFFGEKILINVFSDALNAWKAQDGKSCPPLGVLLQHLSDTLFHDQEFITGIILMEYIVPINDVDFWVTHFKDECEKLTSSGGMDVSKARRVKLSKGEPSIKEKRKKGNCPLSANKRKKNNHLKSEKDDTLVKESEEMGMRKNMKEDNIKLQEDSDPRYCC